jgi:hypothetical protein
MRLCVLQCYAVLCTDTLTCTVMHRHTDVHCYAPLLCPSGMHCYAQTCIHRQHMVKLPCSTRTSSFRKPDAVHRKCSVMECYAVLCSCSTMACFSRMVCRCSVMLVLCTFRCSAVHARRLAARVQAQKSTCYAVASMPVGCMHGPSRFL